MSGTDIDIKTCLDYVPTRFLSSIQSYHFDGIADLNINIENQKKSNKFPAAIQADFDIENASMKSNLPWQIKAAEIQGTFNNGKNRNEESSIVILQSINCQVLIINI